MLAESPSALNQEIRDIKKARRLYKNVRDHLVPLSDTISVEPRVVGRNERWHHQGFGVDVTIYYHGDYPNLGGNKIEGETGVETAVVHKFKAQGFDPLTISRPELTRSVIMLARACGLTERSPLPILPFRLLDRKR